MAQSRRSLLCIAAGVTVSVVQPAAVRGFGSPTAGMVELQGFVVGAARSYRAATNHANSADLLQSYALVFSTDTAATNGMPAVSQLLETMVDPDTESLVPVSVDQLGDATVAYGGLRSAGQAVPETERFGIVLWRDGTLLQLIFALGTKGEYVPLAFSIAQRIFARQHATSIPQPTQTPPGMHRGGVWDLLLSPAELSDDFEFAGETLLDLHLATA
jgi:hypothetical protein